MKIKDIALPDVWRTCNKIRAAIFRVGLNLWDYFKPLDPNNNSLISEKQFVSVLGRQIRNVIGLSDQEISELADYFRVQDGRIFYTQLCEVIHKSVPDFSKNEPYTTGLEFEDPLHENSLGPTEERRLDVLMTKIAATVSKRQLILRPYFQDYELISKNCGTITIAHFARILHFLGILISSDDFSLLVKKYIKDSYTLNYNAFLAKIEAITQFWEDHGFTDVTGDLLEQFPGRLINAELPKLPRPEIGLIPTADIFGSQNVFHPVMKKPPMPEDLRTVMTRIQKYVLTNRIRTVEFFQHFDPLGCGRVTCSQFRRGLDAMGIEAYHRLYLSEPEIWQVMVFYRDPNDQDRICWKTFADDVDQVFTTKGLEKWPEYRVSAPSRDVEELPRRGQTVWSQADPARRDSCEEILEKVKQRTSKRRINLKASFRNYDKHNNGYVTRYQYRQCLTSNGILLGDEELFILEDRFKDEMGFNYFWFLQEIEPEPIEEPLYDDYVRKVRRVNCNDAKDRPTACEKDIVMILAKIKAKVVRDRVDIKMFLKDYDPNNERMVLKCNFVRAMDVCGFNLTNAEVETIMDVFAAPGRTNFVDYHTFVRTIEEAFTQTDLERAPTIIPTPHFPSESDPRNFLNFDERHVVAVALEKLASVPDQNLDEIFQDYDKERCGTVSRQQFLKALSVRNMVHLLSSPERDTVCKAFGFYRGLRDEVDYRALSKALGILRVNLKKKPV